VESNFNPKLIAGLELTLGCLRKGEQVVIVASRLGQLDEIEQRLGEAGILCSRIDSTRTHHSYEAQTFKQGHTKVMLMGIKMAQAFSFENCPNLIVLSLEWNYAAKNQAMGRVYRLNSPKPVKVWCVLNENSVEEVMFDKVASKADAATLCLQGQRVPQASQIVDASEIVAEHLINYTTSGRIVDETICEAQWPALKQQLEKHGI
jgi:SWI/SNF-related matrix-associated actin-dependent regulator of chromatin subfamily A3